MDGDFLACLDGVADFRPDLASYREFGQRCCCVARGDGVDALALGLGEGQGFDGTDAFGTGGLAGASSLTLRR
ncbi:MAG: hypothetical protein PHO57_10680 [Acidithiobacillus sp.]|nr:hypothetical protein [Acidithiobacillus sp.]